MCAVVIIYDGSNFKVIFKEMCEHLKLNYWCIFQGNHKGNSAEKYHRFLKKKSQALIEAAMINLFKTLRPANMCGAAHQLITLISLVALPQLEQNLDFPLM